VSAPLDRDPLHIDPGRRRVLVTECVLRLDDAPRGLAHPPSEGVTRLATDTSIGPQTVVIAAMG
jgi:hypothetical protein